MDYVIEPDLSAACYFYAMSPILKVPVKVQNVHMECMQGDIRFLNVLEDMGCCMTEERDGVRVFPPEDGVLKGGAWDLSGFSDQTLTLAAIAPFADSTVVIAHVGHIRMQECDRIHAILHNLEAMGITCREADGTITIEQGTPHGALIETYEDHRVAMAFTIPGLAVDGIEIKNPSCCRKTFERYFEVLEDALCR
jgi:3-phosphoshikimate 1-carboxyvinyltransferase